MKTRKLIAFRLIAGLLLSIGIVDSSHAESDSEAAVKVAFIYNFFKFIEWPAAVAAQSSYNLCLSSETAFGDALSMLEGKTINGKPLNVWRDVAGNMLENCHMVFVGAGTNPADYLASARILPVVTVSDDAGFVQKGGVIGLLRDGNRLSFEINLDIARANGIHINANLLKLAKNVITSQ